MWAIDCCVTCASSCWYLSAPKQTSILYGWRRHECCSKGSNSISISIGLSFLCKSCSLLPHLSIFSLFFLSFFSSSSLSISFRSCLVLFTHSLTFLSELLPSVRRTWRWTYVNLWYFKYNIFCFMTDRLLNLTHLPAETGFSSVNAPPHYTLS